MGEGAGAGAMATLTVGAIAKRVGVLAVAIAGLDKDLWCCL